MDRISNLKMERGLGGSRRIKNLRKSVVSAQISVLSFIADCAHLGMDTDKKLG